MAWSEAARKAAAEARKRKASRRLVPGQVVRYAKPGPGERKFRFRVLEAHYMENRGDGPDRVHAQVMGFKGRIAPVETISPSELRSVRKPGAVGRLLRRGR